MHTLAHANTQAFNTDALLVYWGPPDLGSCFCLCFSNKDENGKQANLHAHQHDPGVGRQDAQVLGHHATQHVVDAEGRRCSCVSDAAVTTNIQKKQRETTHRASDRDAPLNLAVGRAALETEQPIAQAITKIDLQPHQHASTTKTRDDRTRIENYGECCSC